MAAASPLFSVLIAAYNQGRFLTETLDSVAAQTHHDFEIILVDDGSTDDTAERLEAWRNRFVHPSGKRVVAIRTENGGQSAALEAGFPHCRGRYVALLDSDDCWLPQKLERVARELERSPECGMIVHPLAVIDADGRSTGEIRPKRARLSAGDLRAQIEETGRHVAPATSGIVIKANLFAQLLPMATRGFPSGADAYLTFGASLLAPVCVVNEPLGRYRMHAGGQYIQRMLRVDGLQRTVAMQEAIAERFGLEAAVQRNSVFARNAFALAKLTRPVPEQWKALRRLVHATRIDPAFSAGDRWILSAFWAGAAMLPRRLFAGVWRAFQLRQTGYHRVGGGQP